MRKQNALFTFAYKAAGTIIFVVSMTSLFLDGGRERLVWLRRNKSRDFLVRSNVRKDDWWCLERTPECEF